MNPKYKSIKNVINRLLANPLMENITESDLAQYVGDCIKLIAAPKVYEDKTCDITITNFRGVLPSGILYIIQTAVKKSDNYYPMRYATNTFSSKYHEVGSPDFNRNADNSYSLNNNYIHVDFEVGEVKMLYKSLVLDEEGFPMIPDNVKVELAIENYVKFKYYTILNELGKLPDKVLDRVEQQYDWYVGAAQSAGQSMSLDEAESFHNTFTKTILKPLQHSEFFNNQGATQYLKPNRI